MDCLLCLEQLIEYYPDLDDPHPIQNALKSNVISETDYVQMLSVFSKEEQDYFEDFYKNDKSKIAKYCATKLDKGARNAFVVAKVYLEIGDERIVAAQYLTWLHSNYGEDPLKRMKQKSVVWISHLSYSLIPKVLQDIASIFCKAVLCYELEALIPLMGEFRFKFALACPFERGSAAIGEWFEKAIYLFKGYELSYKNVMIDLKVFETPALPVFLEKYPNYIELKKL
jgi:hypothetical protein